MAGKITSLEKDLEDYLFEVFKARHDLLSRACPGEEECSRSETGRIFEQRQYHGAELPVLRVCHGSEELGLPECEALITKPSHHPPHLTQAIASAYEHAELEESTYAWPDALEPIEWSCLRAFRRAEKKLKRQLDEAEAEEQRAAKAIAELDQKRRR